MKMKSHSSNFFTFFLVAFTIIHVCLADCDNLQDICIADSPGNQFINGLPCKNPTNTSAHNFKSTELSKSGSRDKFGASINIVTASNFPGLNTLGLSIGRTDIQVDGIVNLHSHPRATEMIFVKEGVVAAAFLDTQNKLFQKLLKAGDVFVVPKGLFHFLLNRGVEVATVVSVFNGQNPGFETLMGTTPSDDTTLESVEKVKRKLIAVSDLELHGVNDSTLAMLEIIYS